MTRSIWTGRKATPLFPKQKIETPAELKVVMERQWAEGALINPHQPAQYYVPGYSTQGYKLK